MRNKKLGDITTDELFDMLETLAMGLGVCMLISGVALALLVWLST